MKICFVAQHIYPWLSKDTRTKTGGGAELQQTYIGRGLYDIGHDVSYISLDHGQPDVEEIDGLRVYKSFKPEEGIFGIRFFYPRLYKIWKALKRADAEVYYVRCATFLPGILAIFCKMYGKKFVFAGAHETDFSPNKFRLPTKRDKVLYTYGLRRAHAIIVQSNDQKRLLWENFRLKCKVIRNFSPYNEAKLSDSQRKYILWVATIRAWKRPAQFIRLAESFPHESFVMIGGRASAGDERLFDEIKKRAANVKNLRFLGFQSFEITESYFDKCRVFMNTSEYEGFPNTFLQAWRRGIPVISYVDPDKAIQTNRLGFIVDSEKQLHEGLSTFLSNPRWDSTPIFSYFTEHHSWKVIDQYGPLLNKTLQE